MNIKEYIESGILENYVLGLVSDMEIQEVEQNLLQYPELKSEVNQIEDALAIYAQSKAIPMPVGYAQTIQFNKTLLGFEDGNCSREILNY